MFGTTVYNDQVPCYCCVTWYYRRSQGGLGTMPPKFLEHIVILCFERRFSKQNSVIRIKSNILTPKTFFGLLNFWAGYATAWYETRSAFFLLLILTSDELFVA